jgi:hypothetical protein
VGIAVATTVASMEAIKMPSRIPAVIMMMRFLVIASITTLAARLYERPGSHPNRIEWDKYKTYRRRTFVILRR